MHTIFYKWNCPDGGIGRRAGPAYRRQFQNPVLKISSLQTNKSVYIVYALKSEIKNYIYVGMTSDLGKRINAHNKGYEKTTKPYLPFKLIYTEQCENRQSAREREKYFKSGKGKEYLKKLSKLKEI